MPRWYIVEAYDKGTDNTIYSLGLKGYFYGNQSTDQNTQDVRHRSSFIAEVEYERYGFNTHKGGKRTLYIHELLNKCYEKGFMNIHLAIRPQYSDVISSEIKEYGSYQGAGCWLKNCIDINLPFIATNTTLSVPSTLNYGEQLKLSATIRAAGKCKYYIQESQDGGTSWNNIQSGALTAAEAKQGAHIGLAGENINIESLL